MTLPTTIQVLPFRYYLQNQVMGSNVMYNVMFIIMSRAVLYILYIYILYFD